jgi:hypothetical protein
MAITTAFAGESVEGVCLTMMAKNDDRGTTVDSERSIGTKRG